MMINWTEFNRNCNLSAEKYRFYFGCYDFQDFGRGRIAKLLPVSTVGWGSRAVEMRSNKTVFDCFENDDLGLTDIMREYRITEAFDKVKEDILVAGCGFIGLVDDVVLPFSAQEASGKYDWNTYNISQGAARFSNKERMRGGTVKGEPGEFVYYDDRVTIAQKADGVRTITQNYTGRPLMAALTYHSTVKKPFGHSVLNQAARSAIIDASRTTRQAMISGYYYNNKVDVLLGVDEGTEVDSVETQTGDILKVSPNDNGQNPQIGEFAQHAMTPFTDTILIAARNFCTATELTLANLGISSDAPQSPEALEIVSDDLRDDIQRWQYEVGQQLKYFAMTIFMWKNGLTDIDENLRAKYDAIVPVFKPTYRADLAKIGDGIYKLAEKAPAILQSRSMWRALGLTSAEIDAVVASAITTPNQ